jgi:hypothetical protein
MRSVGSVSNITSRLPASWHTHHVLSISSYIPRQLTSGDETVLFIYYLLMCNKWNAENFSESTKFTALHCHKEVMYLFPDRKAGIWCSIKLPPWLISKPASLPEVYSHQQLKTSFYIFEVTGIPVLCCLNISPMPYLMFHGNEVDSSVFDPAFLSISVRQFHEILSVRLQTGIFQILRPPESDSSSVRIPAPLFSDPMRIHFV